MNTSLKAEIFEVGPRDGLQNEKRLIPLHQKIALVNALSRAGFARIEVASFVSPKWVPQMADSAAVLEGVDRTAGVRFSALTPNLRGFEAAMQARADAVAVFASASEGFSRANLNATIDESLARFAPVVAAARAAGVPVRGYVSCIATCPFDGATAPEAVVRVSEALLAMGCDEISLGDTLGRAPPEAIDRVLRAVVPVIGAGKLAGHFHDTGGVALGNIDVALEHGLRVFDASVGGLGGCPYAPGAAGNVASEAVLAHLAAKGFDTGLDPEKLARAARLAQEIRNG